MHARKIVTPKTPAIQGNLMEALQPESIFGKAGVFGVTIFLACIISSPCNEWRGFTLQPKDKKLPFFDFFKPANYARSTGIGATIMGIALSVGMLVTPLAEAAVAYMKEHLLASIMISVAVIGVVAGIMRK